MKKNIVLTFGCSLVPGFGQMYQGYMKRGVALLFWFSAVLTLAAMLQIEALIFLMPLIWAYSFFDTFNLRNLPPEQRQAMEDSFIPSGAWLDEAARDKWAKSIHIGKVIGWTLVGLGGLVLLNNFWDLLYYLVWEYMPWIGNWFFRIPSLLLAGLVIWLGLYLLKGNRAGKEDELTEYKGGGTDG